MKLYISASKQYDIENTPYSVVDYGSHADVVHTDSLDVLESFENYRKAYDWIVEQDQPKKILPPADDPSEDTPEEVLYVIYAKGTSDGITALYRKHRGAAQYCNGADAERFTEAEVPRYTTSGGKYKWIKQEVPY